jgi:hypothetical protein
MEFFDWSMPGVVEIPDPFDDAGFPTIVLWPGVEVL